MSTKNEQENLIDACLEMLQDDGETIETVLAHFPKEADQIRPTLETAVWLQEKTAAFSPPAEFVGNSKTRLIASMRTQGKEQSRIWEWVLLRMAQWQWRLPTRLHTRPLLQLVAALLLIGSLVLNVHQAFQATGTSLPGDLVYPLKMAQEKMQLAFSFDPAADARLHTHFAQLRLLEVQALALEGRYEQIPATVADFEAHVNSTIRALAQVAEQDQEQALLMASKLQVALNSQTGLVTILASMTPQETRLQFERVRLISEQAIIQVEGIFLPSGWQAAPQAVQGSGSAMTGLLNLGDRPYSFVGWWGFL